jgi:hypothetical protein
VEEDMENLAQRITEYAAAVDEANRRALDPIVIALMKNRQRT